MNTYGRPVKPIENETPGPAWQRVDGVRNAVKARGIGARCLAVIGQCALWLYVSLAHAQGASPGPGAVPGEQPSPGHVEVILSGSRGASVREGALAAFLPTLREPQFLDTPARDSADPLAPCALVIAVWGSAQMNHFFRGLNFPGTVDVRPPPGSNIVGMYDAELARAKGAIPRDDPGKTADMLARILVWQSWGFSARANTLVSALNQRQCLEMMIHPEHLVRALKDVKPANMVFTHNPAVSSFVMTVEAAEGHQWLRALLAPQMLDQRAAPKDHPLAPCALVRTFRLAARLNDLWGRQLREGRLDVAGRQELVPYGEELGKPLGDLDVSARTAEVLAAAVAAEIARANWLSDRLVEQATQGECLNELFEPGGLRDKVRRAGVVLPAR
jgi:hypothetical protein